MHKKKIIEKDKKKDVRIALPINHHPQSKMQKVNTPNLF